MKKISLMSGTREEVIKELKKKIKHTEIRLYTYEGSHCRIPDPILDALKKGDIYESGYNTVEHQIDEQVRDGNQIVTIMLPIVGENDYIERFIISDYSYIRVDMAQKVLDEQPISRVKLSFEMQRDAEKRQNSTEKLAEEFKDKPIKAKLVPVFSDAV